MSFVNKTNHQYIQGRIASNEGVRCQAGGAHDYDRDILKSSYGFTKEGADLASELKGSYAAITSGVTRHNQCGGKKKRNHTKENEKEIRKKKRKRTRKGGFLKSVCRLRGRRWLVVQRLRVRRQLTRRRLRGR